MGMSRKCLSGYWDLGSVLLLSAYSVSLLRGTQLSEVNWRRRAGEEVRVLDGNGFKRRL